MSVAATASRPQFLARLVATSLSLSFMWLCSAPYTPLNAPSSRWQTARSPCACAAKRFW